MLLFEEDVTKCTIYNTRFFRCRQGFLEFPNQTGGGTGYLVKKAYMKDQDEI